MDMMEARRRVMLSMANGTKVKMGAFVGDGTNIAELDVGFKPDIVIVDCDLDYLTAGWVGTKNVTIVRNTVVYQSRHNHAGATAPNSSINFKVGGDYPEYGGTDEQYFPYGTYENGKLIVRNTSGASITCFITDQTYNWVAIKYT